MLYCCVVVIGVGLFVVGGGFGFGSGWYVDLGWYSVVCGVGVGRLVMLVFVIVLRSWMNGGLFLDRVWEVVGREELVLGVGGWLKNGWE